MDQISMFDIAGPDRIQGGTELLSVVKAQFVAGEKKDWQGLFDGFDELYIITYSSGLTFTSSLLKSFRYAEIIYGCEETLPNQVSAILALETSLIEQFTKSEAAKEMSERVSDGTLSLYVSRNTTSHEKIFCLKADDGRTRVIAGSANLSRTAFEGYQRENITYYDDLAAYEWYMDRFRHFRDACSDRVTEKVLSKAMEDPEYLHENVEDIPFLASVYKQKVVFLEPVAEEDETEIEIVARTKDMESELKPLLPKPTKEKGRIAVTLDSIPKVRTVLRDHHAQKKARERKFPKLHLDYEKETLDFNGSPVSFDASENAIRGDMESIDFFLSSLEVFHGDYRQAQRDYYRFFNWCFASIFMPYLRFVADKNNYDVTTLPVFGILYGDSNGGKSTFVQLLTKLMTGKKIPNSPSSDFTYSGVEKLRYGMEGVPINFDDLDRAQFRNHSDKIIKEDEWGISDRLFNYPAIVISTNKLPSLEPPILKRVVGIRIDVRIGKEEGLNNSRKLKESLRNASTSFYGAYIKRMLPKVKEMAERMKEGREEYFADIFKYSSETILEMYQEFFSDVPEYIRKLSFSDYFGDKVVGRSAIRRIKEAWQVEPQSFRINRKKNTLTYTFPESTAYEIKYLRDELPAQLNARNMTKSLVMDLDQAERFFDMKFKKSFWKMK